MNLIKHNSQSRSLAVCSFFFFFRFFFSLSLHFQGYDSSKELQVRSKGTILATKFPRGRDRIVSSICLFDEFLLMIWRWSPGGARVVTQRPNSTRNDGRNTSCIPAARQKKLLPSIGISMARACYISVIRTIRIKPRHGWIVATGLVNVYLSRILQAAVSKLPVPVLSALLCSPHYFFHVFLADLPTIFQTFVGSNVQIRRKRSSSLFIQLIN